MLLQFTTGSVEDRQKFDIHITVLNAGIQPANVLCIFTRFGGRWSEHVVERRAKVSPQTEIDLLSETGLKNVHCEVVLKVDSPSLIITLKGETHYPLHCQTYLVDDIGATDEESSPVPRTMALFWGYTSKGDPF